VLKTRVALVALLALPAAVALGLLAGTASSSSPLGSANGGAYRDVTLLIPEATIRVRAKRGFSKAVLLEAEGTTTGNRKTTSAAGITRWRFAYNNRTTPGFKYRSGFLHYTRALRTVRPGPRSVPRGPEHSACAEVDARGSRVEAPGRGLAERLPQRSPFATRSRGGPAPSPCTSSGSARPRGTRSSAWG
jgi:hypothetical protein